MTEELDNIPPHIKSSIELIFDFLKDPNSKDTQKALSKFLNNLVPHPLYKVLGDVLIASTCIIAIIYCAEKDFIEKSNVQSLLALVIGAVIGARFKS